jgi:hypothetical protein
VDRDVAAVGFDGFVTKPVDPYTFVGSISDHLPAADAEALGVPAVGAHHP